MEEKKTGKQLEDLGSKIKRAFLWSYLNLAFCIIMIIFNVYYEQYIFTIIFCLFGMFGVYILNRNMNQAEEYKKLVEKYKKVGGD